MERNNKNLWIGLVVVLVVVIIIWLVNKNSPSVSTEEGANNDQTALSPDVSIEDISEGSVNVGSPAAIISYANALVKYKDARIQLNTSCQAIPNNVTFKNGANIMVDNRSPVARTVKIGSVFSVKAWGFKIVKLNSATLPVTWLVDCDRSQNVATVLIQK